MTMASSVPPLRFAETQPLRRAEMTFELSSLIEARQGEIFRLHSEYLNPADREGVEDPGL